MYYLGSQSDTNKYQLRKSVYFFMAGKRKCLGEKVAKNTIFLFLANLIKNFKFSVPDNAILPDTETNGGLTLAPKEFKVQISCIW